MGVRPDAPTNETIARLLFTRLSFLAHIPAAVYIVGLTGDVAVSGQHDGNFSHLFHHSKPAHGDYARLQLGIARDHFGYDHGGGNDVDGNPLLYQEARVGVR